MTRPPTLDDIAAEVAGFYSLTTDELLGPHRRRSCAQPRALYYWLARECTRYTLREIAAFCGGRDHSTALIGIREFKDRMARDVNLEVTARTMAARMSATTRDTQGELRED